MQRNRERDVLCLAALALTLTALGCGRSAGVPEDGAVLMRISAAGPPDTPETPDELRVWVYDTTGILFRNARVPAEARCRSSRTRRTWDRSWSSRAARRGACACTCERSARARAWRMACWWWRPISGTAPSST